VTTAIDIIAWGASVIIVVTIAAALLLGVVLPMLLALLGK